MPWARPSTVPDQRHRHRHYASRGVQPWLSGETTGLRDARRGLVRMSERPALEAVADEREPFDPSSVPLYPLLRAEIRESENGEFIGLVDDAVVASDVDLEPVRQAVIAAAAKVAGKRVGALRAIRVRGTGVDGSVFHLVVTATGEVHEATSRGLLGTKPTSGAPPAGQGQKKIRGAGCLFIGLLVLVPLLTLGPVVAMLVARGMGGDTDAAPPKPHSPTQLPVVAPAPYSDVADWSVDLGTSSFAASGDTVDADADRVYVTENGGRDVAAYDAASGVPAWEFTDLDGAVNTGPALTTVEGDQVLAVASSTQLVLLDPETGSEVGEWELPDSGLGVRITATGPVVLVDPTHAQIVVDGELSTRVIPATGQPVAPGSGGSLVVVSAGGQLWAVTSDSIAGKPTALPRVRRYLLDGAAGWTGSRLVLAYRPRTVTGTDHVRLVSVDSSRGAQQWVTKPLPPLHTVTEGELGLLAAPAGEWGIYGTKVVDLSNGEIVHLANDWTTTTISDDHAFGTGKGRPLVATPAGVTAASRAAAQLDSTTDPVAPQATSGARAFLVQNNGSHSVLYALDVAEPGTAAGTPSSSPAPSSATEPSRPGPTPTTEEPPT